MIPKKSVICSSIGSSFLAWII